MRFLSFLFLTILFGSVAQAQIDTVITGSTPLKIHWCPPPVVEAIITVSISADYNVTDIIEAKNKFDDKINRIIKDIIGLEKDKAFENFTLQDAGYRITNNPKLGYQFRGSAMFGFVPPLDEQKTLNFVSELKNKGFEPLVKVNSYNDGVDCEIHPISFTPPPPPISPVSK